MMHLFTWCTLIVSVLSVLLNALPTHSSQGKALRERQPPDPNRWVYVPISTYTPLVWTNGAALIAPRDPLSNQDRMVVGMVALNMLDRLLTINERGAWLYIAQPGPLGVAGVSNTLVVMAHIRYLGDAFNLPSLETNDRVINPPGSPRDDFPSDHLLNTVYRVLATVGETAARFELPSLNGQLLGTDRRPVRAIIDFRVFDVPQTQNTADGLEQLGAPSALLTHEQEADITDQDFEDEREDFFPIDFDDINRPYERRYHWLPGEFFQATH